MNLPLFIAWRYLFAKKSHHAINIISGISAGGVALATLAMVCTMSVFNGFQDLVAGLFTDFDPQLKVMPAQGRNISLKSPVVAQLQGHESVAVVTPCLEDQALVVQGGRQQVVTLKGVADNWNEQANLPHLLYPQGTEQLTLHADVLEYGLMGIQLAARLGLNADFPDPIPVYAPKRGERVNMANPMSSFNRDELLSPGHVFAVKQAKYDANYILCSLGFAQRLFDREGEASHIEVKLKDGVRQSQAQAQLQDLLGAGYKVLNRYEQQEDVFRIMRIEKLIAYLFLTFILLVATFNIIGSLSMLMIDKKRDVQTLRNLGARPGQITQIFMLEGRMISFLGAFVGILLGVALCWAQQEFGFISMGRQEGAFIVEAYPVSVRPLDILLIFLTVLAVSWLVVWWPVRRMSKLPSQSSPLDGEGASA